VAVLLVITLVATVAQVVSAIARDDADHGYGLAVGTALLCLLLLKPFAGACALAVGRWVETLRRAGTP
jgi:hypothetical protein